MKRVYILLVGLGVVLAGVGIYFLLQKNQSDNNVSKYDWSNPEEVFNVVIPENFDDFQRQRVVDKIATSRELYNTKKEDTWTWINIGNLYKFVEDYDRAIGAYEKALSIFENERISLSNLANIYEKYQPDYEKAAFYYDRLLATSGSIPEYVIGAARFYANKMNDKEKAEAVFVKGLQQTSNNHDVLIAMITFYEDFDAEKAGYYARILIEAYPENQMYKEDFGHLLN